MPVIALAQRHHARAAGSRYARLIEQAGADALELNVYYAAPDLDETGDEVERRGLEVVRAVKGSVAIPVAVKLSPFYSSLGNFARRLDEAGADGLVLFNRFYQPDIDVEELELLRVNLSSPAELLLRLRWLGVLSGRIRASLAATGGVHTAVDVVKAVMAGAHAIQMVSALLRHGPAYLRQVARRPGALAGGARVRVAAADAGQHEPAPLPRPRGVPAGQLHPPPAELGSGLSLRGRPRPRGVLVSAPMPPRERTLRKSADGES